jgi:hypothetical protein
MFDPTVWPQGCPPGTATVPPKSGLTVYRIVSHDPPIADDFVSYHELGKAVAGGADQQCRSRSLSVFTDLAEAVARAQQSPQLGNLIAEGVLDEAHGVVKPSRGAHVSWWPCDGIARHAGFTVVQKV